MSTRIVFDLQGLSSAIESGDTRYRAALYAERAEVWIIDADRPTDPGVVLHGRPAIAAWLDTLYSHAEVHRVIGASTDGSTVALVEESVGHGDVRLYSRSAELDRGQIIRETAMVTRVTSLPTQQPASAQDAVRTG